MSATIFQFHKGAIRTSKLREIGYEFSKFQFHKGAIRTYCSVEDHHNHHISIP